VSRGITTGKSKFVGVIRHILFILKTN